MDRVTLGDTLDELRLCLPHLPDWAIASISQHLAPCVRLVRGLLLVKESTNNEQEEAQVQKVGGDV